MADLRIVDAPLLSTVKGTEKLPTGGEGNFSVSVNQVADFAKLKWVLATEGYVDTAVGNVQADLNLHKNNSSNPHQVTKTQVGLGNVDNTADLDKPVSNATQSAIITANSGKADKSYVDSQDQLKADKNNVEASLLLKADKVDLTASKITSDSNQTQQAINDFGGAKWYNRSGGYDLGATVKLENGDIVKSTIDGNTNDPNVDMTGWIKANDASLVVDGDKNQKQINDEQLVKNSSYDNLYAQNSLWQGSFSSFQMGRALTTQDLQRVQIPCGVTHARGNFATGTTIYNLQGSVKKNGLRLQRNATNTNTSAHNMVVNLTHAETRNLVGKKCCFSFYVRKGEDYSGSNVNFKIQCSREQEQPILNADGTYTNGNEYLLDTPIIPLSSVKLQHFIVDVPADITQVAIVVSVPFTGTAGINDFIDIEGLAITISDKYIKYQDLSDDVIETHAKTRYQSSYPYGAPRGANTEQGAVNAISASANGNWAFALNVKFEPKFPIVPQFLFQSPTSGTESRILNKDTGANVNGLAFGLSDSGVTITNNAIVTAGHRFLCHWTAQLIF